MFWCNSRGSFVSWSIKQKTEMNWCDLRISLFTFQKYKKISYIGKGMKNLCYKVMGNTDYNFWTGKWSRDRCLLLFKKAYTVQNCILRNELSDFKFSRCDGYREHERNIQLWYLKLSYVVFTQFAMEKLTKIRITIEM